MLKKTTVYLSDLDLSLLQKKAAMRNISMAEAIRWSIQEACIPKTKLEKALWDAQERIWEATRHIPAAKIEAAVNRAVKEVRNAKKKRHRS